MSINLVQKFIAEVDSVSLLEQYLRIAMTTALNSQQELAVKVVDRNKRYSGLPVVISDMFKNFPVILIGGWYLPEDGEKENSYFRGYGPWITFRTQSSISAVDAAIQHIKELLEKQGSAWGAQFEEKFGDGYNQSFNEHDGSVDIGFELRACGCFPEQLAISLVHIYYGK